MNPGNSITDYKYNIQQTWWHVEDVYYPIKAKKIRQVMDIFTPKNDFLLEMSDYYYIGLKVKGRNSLRQEIGFLENDDGTILLNLDLSSYPFLPDKYKPACPNCRHVKLEVEYVLIEEIFLSDFLSQNGILNLFWKYIFQKKISTNYFNGKMQPEMYLTLPKGWKVFKNGNGMDIAVYSNEELLLPEFFIFRDRIDGKRRYHYLTDPTTLSEFFSAQEQDSKYLFEFTYVTQLSNKVAFLSWSPVIFLIFSSFILYSAFQTLIYNHPFNFDSSIGIGFLIILTSFSFFYGSLLKEGYNIPGKYYFAVIVIVSLIAIIVSFGLPMVSPDISLTDQYQQNWYYNITNFIHTAKFYF